MNAPRNIFSKEQLDQDRARVDASSEFQPLRQDSALAYLRELQGENMPEHQIRIALGHRYDAMCVLRTSDDSKFIEVNDLKGTKVELPL